MPWIRNTGNVTLTLPSTPSLGYDTPTTYLRHNPPLYYATLQHIAALPERGSLPLNKSGDVQAHCGEYMYTQTGSGSSGHADLARAGSVSPRVLLLAARGKKEGGRAGPEGLGYLHPSLLREVRTTPLPPVRPLRLMDLCSGAGGLSSGLELRGFRSTKPSWCRVQVYTEDCSNLLDQILGPGGD